MPKSARVSRSICSSLSISTNEHSGFSLRTMATATPKLLSDELMQSHFGPLYSSSPSTTDRSGSGKGESLRRAMRSARSLVISKSFAAYCPGTARPRPWPPASVRWPRSARSGFQSRRSGFRVRPCFRLPNPAHFGSAVEICQNCRPVFLAAASSCFRLSTRRAASSNFN